MKPVLYAVAVLAIIACKKNTPATDSTANLKSNDATTATHGGRSFPGVSEQLLKESKSVEDFLSKYVTKDQYFRLIIDSGSVQKGTEEFPRVILFELNKPFVAFSTDPTTTDYNLIEMINIDPTTKKWVFGELSFSESGQYHLELNPHSCQECHNGTPNWPFWDFTEKAVPQRDHVRNGSIPQKEQIAILENIFQNAQDQRLATPPKENHPSYERLKHLKNSSIKLTVQDVIDSTANAEFNTVLEDKGRRNHVPQKIKETPDYHFYKYLFVAALHGLDLGKLVQDLKGANKKCDPYLDILGGSSQWEATKKQTYQDITSSIRNNSKHCGNDQIGLIRWFEEGETFTGTSTPNREFDPNCGFNPNKMPKLKGSAIPRGMSPENAFNRRGAGLRFLTESRGIPMNWFPSLETSYVFTTFRTENWDSIALYLADGDPEVRSLLTSNDMASIVVDRIFDMQCESNLIPVKIRVVGPGNVSVETQKNGRSINSPFLIDNSSASDGDAQEITTFVSRSRTEVVMTLEPATLQGRPTCAGYSVSGPSQGVCKMKASTKNQLTTITFR